MNIVNEIEKTRTGGNNRPIKNVIITNSGSISVENPSRLSLRKFN